MPRLPPASIAGLTVNVLRDFVAGGTPPPGAADR